MNKADKLIKNAQTDFDRLASYSTKEQSKHGSKEEVQATDVFLHDALSKVKQENDCDEEK